MAANGARIARAIKSDEVLAHAAAFEEKVGRVPYITLFRVEPPREPQHWLIVEHVGGVQVGCQVHSWAYIERNWERLMRLFHMTALERQRLGDTLAVIRSISIRFDDLVDAFGGRAGN